MSDRDTPGPVTVPACEIELLARELLASQHQSSPAMLNRRAALATSLAELVLARLRHERGEAS